MKNNTLIQFSVLLPILLIMGCSRKTIDQFPDTEIVYQANERESGVLGFINGDGSNSTLVEVDFFANLPSWSRDGKTLFFSQIDGDEAYIPTRIGDLSTLREGKPIIRCRRGTSVGGDIYIYKESSQVVISDGFEVNLVDAEKCRNLKTFLDYTDTNKSVTSMSISRDGNILLFSEHSYNTSGFGKEFAINKMDLRSGDVYTIGRGINPTISPDNSKITYVWRDGIYLMDSDGTNIQRIIEYTAGERVGFYSLAPSPNWSPDGEWLVYHKCTNEVPDSCVPVSDFSIFKFNVLNGTETKLVDGGLYPYWR